jgi:hypothetical protein
MRPTSYRYSLHEKQVDPNTRRVVAFGDEHHAVLGLVRQQCYVFVATPTRRLVDRYGPRLKRLLTPFGLAKLVGSQAADLSPSGTAPPASPSKPGEPLDRKRGFFIASD